MVPILITLAVLLLALVCCVVLVPFHLSLTGGYAGRFFGLLRISWLWGAVKIVRALDKRTTRVYLLGRMVAQSIDSGKKEKKPIQREKPHARRRRNAADILPNMPEAVRFLRKVMRSLSPKGTAKGIFGLGNPADTGVVFGIASAVLALVPIPVRLIPDFRQSIIAFDGSLDIRIFIAGLLAIGIGEFLSPRGRRLIRSVRSS